MQVINKVIRFKLSLLITGIFLCCTFMSSLVIAEASPIHEFFLKEPVFGGQARIVEAGDAKAPLIVLVHGLNSSADIWFPFIPALTQHFHVLSFDLPGFGQSSKANKLYSPDNYVAFIHYVLSHYPAQSIILVGHSLGGNIALRYAATYPQQINRLLLVDAAGILHRRTFSKFLSHFGIQVLPTLYDGQQQDLQSLADGVLGALTQYSSIAELGESALLNDPMLREQLLGGYPPAIATHAMMMTEFKNVLDNFRVPTLIVWGGEDDITPIRTGKILAANFDNAGLIVIEHAGHSPMHDQPAQFARVLMQFVDTNTNQRDAFLQQHRYAAPRDSGADAERIGNCNHENNKVFRGRYKLVVIDQCSGVLLQDLFADSVTITNSQATIENCNLNSSGKSLLLKNSDVTITACRIQGSPAIDLSNTKLDIAGSHVTSNTEAIKADAASASSDILFSITQVNSRAQARLMHGPVSLSSGQAL
jgi:pimeloyl-ACP methyl ester carboxylesterase